MGRRTILHVDMDAFFVSVELLDHPELRGRPVVVGGSGPRGVVAAASYEARAFGVFSAMPGARARRLCPDAVFLPGRYERYQENSAEVMAIFGSFTPLVEPISLDEAFLDVTGARRLHGDGETIGHSIRARVAEEVHLTCSVGVAPVKFVAKLASEAAKPRAAPSGPITGAGVFEVGDSGLLAFLHPLPVQALWGVGPATLKRLERLGVVTVGDLACLPVDLVRSAVGDAAGRHLHGLANGRDERDVVADRRAKTISHEETYPTDLVDPAVIDREALRLSEAVASRLRKGGVAGRTITVKVRFGDFSTVTRSTTRPSPTDSPSEIVAAARTLLGAVDPSAGVRLLGVGVSGFDGERARQLAFDLDGASAVVAGASGTSPSTPVDVLDRAAAERAVDEIRQRFGDASIGPAALLDDGELRLRRRVSAPWGPAAADDEAPA